MVTKEPLFREALISATLTGLEPATSAVTGRRANQLRYRARDASHSPSDPNGIRTRATAVKGRRPRPLNDGALNFAIIATGIESRVAGPLMQTNRPG